MTMREFTLTCLLVRIISFIALIICIGFVADHKQTIEWVSASFLAGFVTFFFVSAVGQEHYADIGRANQKIGDSRFEKIAVLGSLWVPIMLTTFAIFSVLHFSINLERIAWILVVLGGNVGLSASRLYINRRR